MPIRRTPKQSDESLEAFYSRSDWHDLFKVTAERMLGLLKLINHHFIQTEIIAFTSHQRLCIIAEGDEIGSSVIIIAHSPLDEFHIEYKVSFHKSPWEEAWMTGTCSTVDDVFRYLLISMNETERWQNNDELKALSTAFVSEH